VSHPDGELVRPAPSAQPRPGRTFVWIVGGVVASCAVGGAIFAAVMWLSDDIRGVTHEFVGHLRAGRNDAAYRMTSARLRAQVSAESFPSYVEGRAPTIRSTTDDSINGFGGGGDEQCVIVDLTKPGSFFSSTVYVLLLKEGDVWRIDGLEAREPELCPD